MNGSTQHEITHFVRAWSEGQHDAPGRLLPQVYEEFLATILHGAGTAGPHPADHGLGQRICVNIRARKGRDSKQLVTGSRRYRRAS